MLVHVSVCLCPCMWLWMCFCVSLRMQVKLIQRPYEGPCPIWVGLCVSGAPYKNVNAQFTKRKPC